MLIIVAICIIAVQRYCGSLASRNGDLIMGRILTLMLVFNVGVEGRITQITFATWANKISFVRIVSCSSFSFNIHLTTFKHVKFLSNNYQNLNEILSIFPNQKVNESLLE